MQNTVDFSKLADDTLANIIASGFIEKKIKETLEKTITDIVSDTFRSYGDFGKSLRDAISQKMKVNFDELNLPIYNEYILALIEGSVKSELTDRGYAEIADRIKSILGEALKTEYTLTEMVDMFREENKDSHDYGDRFTVRIEPSSGFYWISFDEGDDTKKYECEYRFGLDKEGKIFALTIGSKKYDGPFQRAISYISTSAFGEFLVRAKAQGVKIKVDEEDADYFDTNYFAEE